MSNVPRSLAVIVVSWNTREVLARCLNSVRQHLGQRAELIVVDNASADGSAEMVARDFPDARLLRNETNLGFGRGANQGMAAARAADLVLLNSDALLLDDGLLTLCALLRSAPDIAMVGPRIVLETGKLQCSARRFPSLQRLLLSELWLHRALSRSAAAERLLGPYWDHASEHEVDWLVGACLVVRREVFEHSSGFDPSIFMYGEEVEWCRRIRASGQRIVFSPRASVLHLNHKSADRLFGDAGRTDRCLLSENDLLKRWNGSWAPWAADALRVSGAVLRLLLFAPRRLRASDLYARDVIQGAQEVLAHYGRRLRGTTWNAA